VVETDAGVYGLQSEANQFPFGWFIAGSMFPSCGVGMAASWAETKRGSKIPVFNANLGARAPKGHKESTNSNFSMFLMNKDAYEAMSAGDLVMAGRGGAFQFRGSVGNDDPESWASETRVSGGAVSRHQTIKYNALDGASEPAEFPKGLGLVHRGFSKDDNQWHFWLAYYDWMTRD
jgi:hypothetical protein